MTIFCEVLDDDSVLQFIVEDEVPDGPNRYFAVSEATPWNPPSPTHQLRWVAGAPRWVETATLEGQRAAKIEAISAACHAHIVAGFVCPALGAPHLYPAKPQDQANLVASVTDSLLAGADPAWATPFWCADAAGAWEFRPHTITQIQQVGREGKAATLAAMSRNEALRQQISTASADQLAGINW